MSFVPENELGFWLWWEREALLQNYVQGLEGQEEPADASLPKVFPVAKLPLLIPEKWARLLNLLLGHRSTGHPLSPSVWGLLQVEQTRASSFFFFPFSYRKKMGKCGGVFLVQIFCSWITFLLVSRRKRAGTVPSFLPKEGGGEGKASSRCEREKKNFAGAPSEQLCCSVNSWLRHPSWVHFLFIFFLLGEPRTSLQVAKLCKGRESEACMQGTQSAVPVQSLFSARWIMSQPHESSLPPGLWEEGELQF